MFFVSSVRRPPALLDDESGDLDHMQTRAPSPPPELLAELAELRQELDDTRQQVVAGQQQLQAHTDLIVRLNADLAAAREGEASASSKLAALQERLRARLGGLEAALRQALEREQQQQGGEGHAEAELAALEEVGARLRDLCIFVHI